MANRTEECQLCGDLNEQVSSCANDCACTLAGIHGLDLDGEQYADSDTFYDALSECDYDELIQDMLVDIFPLGSQDDDAFSPGDEGLEPYMDITVDSGAGLPVANPKHFPDAVVRPSEGSKRGQQFMGPGGHLMKNQGQMSPEIVVESGAVGRINFAAADIRKPLLAVSAINAKGSPVWFDGSESFILPKGSENLPEIRRLIKLIRSKIKLHQKNGTYAMRAWRRPTGPFQGPGW